jgi:tetrahydromethanopterin S-methyltransferase subunit D
MRNALLLSVAVVLVGCGGTPTAMSVCKQLEGAGIGTGCKEEKPGGMFAAATAKAELTLPNGKMCQCLQFEKPEHVDAIVEAMTGAAMLVGPHRYASSKAKIVVQCNEEMGLEEGKKVKAMVEAL